MTSSSMGAVYGMRALGHTRELFFFFFNDTATTEIYTLSLHDALPISRARKPHEIALWVHNAELAEALQRRRENSVYLRSEEHTSELQSRLHLVCRLLLEKKKTGQAACRGTWCATRRRAHRRRHNSGAT